MLEPGDIVGVWERGAAQPAWKRALIALEAAHPELPASTIAAMSVGERNARLLALRAAVVGPAMQVMVSCPQCGEPLEFEQSVDELLDDYAPPAEREFDIVAGEGAARVRLLTSDDLAAAALADDEEGARQRLASRAIRHARWRGEAVAASDVPLDLITVGAAQLTRRDPLAHLAIPLACAACGHVWSATLEIASFFWAELEHLARRLLDDVIALARAFGWGERSIIAMSPARRRYYLDAIG